MRTPINQFKAALRNRTVQRGIFLALGSETVTEIAGMSGFDYCLIDGEHAPFDPGLIRRQIVTLEAAGTPALVRVPANEDWILKQVLDAGAQSVMVPMVASAAEARAAVAACRYPPKGRRGMGGSTMRAGAYGARLAYPAEADTEICVIVQVESSAGLSEILAIAAVEGVDCVFIGPADLGADLGYRDDLDAQALWDVVAEAVHLVDDTRKAAGVFVPPHRAEAMVAAGARVLAVGSDAGLVTGAFRALARGER